ncbi:TIGR04255 family protein [Methyloglobulus sp.]|uniref:TIGR04255 family protein n=1 Tax=Methyloglobulus sp. TaxID=2518622 RepID=UPI0039898F32
MQDVLNQDGHFEPIHAAHAIERVILVVQFDRDIGDDSFTTARKTFEQFKNELPGQVEISGFPITVGHPVKMPPTGVTGVFFRRIEPDGTIENEFRVERSSLTFITTRYTRWDDIWKQSSQYFNALIPIYSKQSKITGVGLNFVDKFKWSGDLTKCNPNLLLRAKSNYICPHVFEAKDFWHSHTGAFIRVDEYTKRLVNINVDYVDENRPDGTQRIIAVTTVINNQLNQPEYKPYEVEENSVLDFVNKHMQELHQVGKEVFGNIINDNMCKRIALVE